MKKLWIPFGAILIFLTTGFFLKQTNLSAETADPNYDKVSQEAGRNRELLEIWKEHVKTLTQERDDAYRQLERMKTGSPGSVAQFGGVENAPLPSPAASQQIQGLQSEVSRLRSQLQSKTTGDPNREIQMQFSALQSQLQQTKKDLAEARSEKDRLIQEKERALSKAERLEGESEAWRSDRAPESSDRQARGLQYENETLRAHIEKLEVVEKELASTREYFTPLVKDLQEKNDNLSAENAALRSDIAGIRKGSSTIAAELDSAKQKNQRMETELRAAQAEREQAVSEMESYKSQFQKMSADREMARALESQYRILKDQNESLQKAYAVLEQNSHRSKDGTREVEKYKAALSANLADMKNLKGNFEAYLESLVASFEERQK